MKRGILVAFLFWIGFSVSWGQELTEDPEVWPPIIKKNRREVMEGFGKIEFNLDLDGSVKGKNSEILESDEATKNYILKSKNEFIAAGKNPILHLKGVTNPKFNTVRRVLTIANDIGVNHMIYSVEMGGVLKVEDSEVPKENSEQPKEATDVFESRLKSLMENKPRKEDPSMSLPGNKPVENAKDVFIHLNAQGQVFIGKGKKPLDENADNREMPLLKAELEKLKTSGEEFSVTISADGEVKPQRVIDLLNTLATADITQITVVKE